VRRGTREPTKLPNRAKDLPKSRMSDFIERGMEASLVAAYEKKAEKAKIKLEDVEKAKGLCIRVISHIETKHVVREEVSSKTIEKCYAQKTISQSLCPCI
jgi:E1A/CREB-binding protein